MMARDAPADGVGEDDDGEGVGDHEDEHEEVVGLAGAVRPGGGHAVLHQCQL